MRFVFGLVCLAILPSCASPQLMTTENRRVEFIEKTNVPQKKAFDRAVVSMGKNWGNSKEASRVVSSENFQVVIKGNTPCNELRAALLTTSYNLAFTLDFQAKDKRVKLSFEDLRIEDEKGDLAPSIYGANQITSQEQIERVKTCLEPIRTKLVAAINAEEKSW